MERDSTYEKFCKEQARPWPEITRARRRAREVFELLQSELEAYQDGDVNVILFGSLARLEWTSGSDVDWTLLIDGATSPEHYKTAQAIQSHLSNLEFEEKNLVDPGTSGIFGTLTFSHDLVHLLGGQADTNINTTRRILLALESIGLKKDVRRRTLRAVIARYLQDDFNFQNQEAQMKTPRFLLNDIVRFWRTLCVDYGMKRWTEESQWALRNVKLRMSRKWLFASGLLMMFGCAEKFVPPDETEPSHARTLENLDRLMDQTPTDTIIEQLSLLGLNTQVAELLTLYDKYLKKLNNEDVRDRLSKISPEAARNDEEFSEFKEIGRALQDLLIQVFFEAHDELSSFTKEYGVF